MLLDLPRTEIFQLRTGKAKLKIDQFNQRIRILDFDAEVQDLVETLDNLAKNYHLGKMIYVASQEEIISLTPHGFSVEAWAQGFLKGETGYFLSKFTRPERRESIHSAKADEVLKKAGEYRQEESAPMLRAGYEIRAANLADAKEMAILYDEVFETYPTPMNNPDYVLEVMQDNLIFKVATYNNKIVSIASADMDPENLNAEITDCATLPQHRGNGLMEKLIAELEKELQQRNYLTAYTIARSISMGMNIVFAKLGYHYGGRMINNCQICGQLEDMNIWAKSLI